MISPNLASRPFLNTRPVWLVTGAAAVLTVLLVILNVSFYIRSNRTLAPQLARYQQLRAEHQAMTTQVQTLVSELEKVPWRSLEGRVEATNVVLREWSFSWVRLLDDIERVVPREVRILKIGPSIGPEEVTLSLFIVARSRDAMIEFLTNLIDDPSFSKPIPIREGLPEESDLAGYELTLRVTYHPEEAGP